MDNGLEKARALLASVPRRSVEGRRAEIVEAVTALKSERPDLSWSVLADLLHRAGIIRRPIRGRSLATAWSGWVRDGLAPRINGAPEAALATRTVRQGDVGRVRPVAARAKPVEAALVTEPVAVERPVGARADEEADAAPEPTKPIKGPTLTPDAVLASGLNIITGAAPAKASFPRFDPNSMDQLRRAK